MSTSLTDCTAWPFVSNTESIRRKERERGSACARICIQSVESMMCLALSLLCWSVQRALVSGGWSQEEAAEMDMDSRAPHCAEHTLTAPFWQHAHPSTNELVWEGSEVSVGNPPSSPQTISQTRRPARAVFSRLCSLLGWQLSWGYTTRYFSSSEVRTKPLQN